MSRVVLAMSGGVDSSVAAHLLLEAGHDVIGVFMRHGVQSASCQPAPKTGHTLPLVRLDESRTDHKQGCCTARDAEDARRVADLLEIPFYALDLSADFDRIIDYFVKDYSVGRTPNPCIACNNWLKFGKLFDYADGVGAEFVATGHYARIVRNEHQTSMLYRGIDRSKDQSYVLFGVERSRLSRMLLPVGAYDKPRIRQLASQLGLRVADKRDSQEICFVTSGKHGDFVAARTNRDTAGQIVTTTGQVAGEHDGIERFTVGQRKGLGVALGRPQFVVRIEADTRRVIIGGKEELACKGLVAGDTNWLCDPPRVSRRCRAQIRYNSQAVDAYAQLLDNGELEVRFDAPCFGVAPGQAVVCYDDDRVMGGGWIDRTQVENAESPELGQG